jgi:hypothetical protein
MHQSQIQSPSPHPYVRVRIPLEVAPQYPLDRKMTLLRPGAIAIKRAPPSYKTDPKHLEYLLEASALWANTEDGYMYDAISEFLKGKPTVARINGKLVALNHPNIIIECGFATQQQWCDVIEEYSQRHERQNRNKGICDDRFQTAYSAGDALMELLLIYPGHTTTDLAKHCTTHSLDTLMRAMRKLVKDGFVRYSGTLYSNTNPAIYFRTDQDDL